MYSVCGDVSSVFTRTLFQSVSVVACGITFTHISIHHPFVVCLCMCTFFAIWATLALWLCLHCNLCRTASTRGVKMPCQSLIHWLTCNLFCPAALSPKGLHMCVCAFTPAHLCTAKHLTTLVQITLRVLSVLFHEASPFVWDSLSAPCHVFQYEKDR